MFYMCFVITTLVERIEFCIVQMDVSTKELTSYVLYNTFKKSNMHFNII